MSRISRSAEDRLEDLSVGKAKLLQLLLEKDILAQQIRPYPRSDTANGTRVPTSWAQQRLWFIDQLEGGGAAYHSGVVLRFRGVLDQKALQKALNTLVLRHEVLRTVFVSMDGEPTQEIRLEDGFSLQVIDLSSHDASLREAQVVLHKRADAREYFDLRRGPLIRGRLLRLHAEEHVLMVTVHHIVSDGWSMGVLIRELRELYGAYSQGRHDPLKPLPVQYADYAQWQRQWLRGDPLERQLSYWRVCLEGAEPQLQLPADRPRPTIQRYRGKNVQVRVNAQLTADLYEYTRRYGLTLFMTLYAAWAILLSRLSGQEDILIGTAVANRRRPELEGLIGFFVNTLVLRVQVSGDVPIPEFLERVKQTTLAAYDHQDIPFEQIVEALRPERSLARHPIFQVMFVLQNTPQGELQWPGLVATTEEGESDTSKFDLLLALEEQKGEIRGVANFDTDLFDQQTVERWIACFTALLTAMVTAEHARVADLPVLPEGERHQLLELFNATQAVVPRETLVHQLFEEQVSRTPNAVAAVHGQKRFTYAELNGRANQLARYLQGRGVGPDQPAGICLGRGLDMVVALIATMKAGGAYLPLDPNSPHDRLQYMLEDAAPSVVLTESALRDVIPATKAQLIELDQRCAEISNNLGDDLTATPGLTAENLVYVIYTSGSTGQPKGTAMPHRAMVNLIEWHNRNLPITEQQRVLQFAALSFDVAFQEIFSTLCAGGTLVLIDEWVRKDPAALMELLTRQSVGRLFVPPLMLQSLAEYAAASNCAPGALRDVITAGEQLRITPEVVDFFGRFEACRLHNHYGPTETHVVTALTLQGYPQEWPILPSIGQPITNTQIYILDRQRQPVPIGVPGEIYIGGANVARGYLKRSELTGERFIRNPFSSDSKARMYKTGDLGRWRTDGSIEYLGRNDDQVKLRGYRIELGEIAAQLSRHPAVKESSIVVREDTPGEKRLVAYLTQRSESDLGPEQLRSYLKDALPEYMVPSAFVVLNQLPLTPNGKLDRRALPVPDVTASASLLFEAPHGEVEKVLATIWEELLQVDRIGRQDNFFDLGGHSLLAVKALFKINERFGSSLTVTDVYINPTIADLATRVRGATMDDSLVDLSREAVVDDEVIRPFGSRRTPAGALLLTGGTGFVGRFLLTRLLRETNAVIYCTVRAPSQHQALSRLRTTLAKWDLSVDDFESRIVPIPCDIRLPRLGIDSSSYETLSHEVDGIFHCATSMNHLETYSMSKRANVDSARELLKLATSKRLKLVNYISSLGVFSPQTGVAMRSVDETSPIDLETHSTLNGYAASKWVAEKIFLNAADRGVPCNIFRLGLVWADTQMGRYDELQREYRVLKSCLLSGYGIKEYRTEPPTPVDYVARAVAFLADQHPDGKGIFHITASRPMSEGLYERCNEIAGTSLQMITAYDWISEMKRLHQAGLSLPVVPLIEYAFTMDEASFREHQDRARSARVQVRCERTHGVLERAGIVVPPFTDKVIKASVDSIVARDPDLRDAENGLSHLAVATRFGLPKHNLIHR